MAKLKNSMNVYLSCASHVSVGSEAGGWWLMVGPQMPAQATACLVQ